MATYSTLGQIATQPDFVNRVSISMSKAAVAIYNEGSGVTGHAARALFATKVLNGTFNLTAAVVGVLTSAAIIAEASGTIVGNGIADTDIDTQIASIWNALAGA